MINKIFISNNWSTIESAPLDGSVILGCDLINGHVSKVRYKSPEWECVNSNNEGMGIGFYPTHWQLCPGINLLNCECKINQIKIDELIKNIEP